VHVYDIGAATFDRYADDLIARLDSLRDDRPLVWVAVGGSGGHVIQAIERRMGRSPRAWFADIQVVRLGWDPAAGVHQFLDSGDAAVVDGADVLLIDSVVNSGGTMLGAHEYLRGEAARPKSVMAYAIAVRQNADFVPNLFSIAIGPNDRVFLPWHDQRPNNRLTMRGIYRSLAMPDVQRPPIRSGQDFMDRVHWRDRWYTLKAEQERRILVCEIDQRIAAFISFLVEPDDGELHVDELACDLDFSGKGIAGALMRYAETLARGTGCARMSLWAHASVVKYYEGQGFRVQNRTIECGADGDYHYMVRGLGSSKADMGFPA